MTKTRIRRIAGAATLAGVMTIASAGTAAAGTDEDDDDGDDDTEETADADPTVVNTGGAFDDDGNMVPLTLAAVGMAGLAGGAFAVRRRQTEV